MWSNITPPVRYGLCLLHKLSETGAWACALCNQDTIKDCIAAAHLCNVVYLLSLFIIITIVVAIKIVIDA